MKKIFFVAFLLFTNFAFAQMPDIVKGKYVNDFAHVLTSDQVDALNRRAAEIEKQSKMQLIIVLVDKLPQGVPVNTFITNVDVKWQTRGSDENTDRVVYVAGIQQSAHKMMAVRGVNAAVLFNGEKCSEILKVMNPYYHAKDYNGGLQVLVTSVASALNVTDQPTSRFNAFEFFMGALVAVALYWLVRFFLKSRNGKQADA